MENIIKKIEELRILMLEESKEIVGEDFFTSSLLEDMDSLLEKAKELKDLIEE
jgi:hypothetical protein